MTDVLPDSRLHSLSGGVMADWPMPDGTTVRVECEPVYCANCGKPYGYCPMENTAFCFYLCNRCFETYGEVAGTFAVPDEEWARAVCEEMMTRFGQVLSDTEANLLYERGELGRMLEHLEAESPYPSLNKRSKR